MFDRFASKLPAYCAAGCLFDQQTAEQASSEAISDARFQALEKTSFLGKVTLASALDLTAGLGVDTLHLSRHFQRVFSVETDPIRYRRLVDNLKLLGVENCKAIYSDALIALDALADQVDFIFLDPDRRSTGSKLPEWRLAQPKLTDVLALLAPHHELWVKQSPAFDFRAALRDFPQLATIQALSWKNECRETLWKFPAGGKVQAHTQACSPNTTLIATKVLEDQSFHFAKLHPVAPVSLPERSEGQYLIDPDPSLRALNLSDSWAGEQNVAIYSTGRDGWLLADKLPLAGLFRAWKIESTYIGSIRSIGRWLKETDRLSGHVVVRGLPVDVPSLSRKWGLVPKGNQLIWVGPAHNGNAFAAVGVSHVPVRA